MNFSYTTQQVPPNYQCSGCGKKGCKLWRQYNTLASHIRLLCVDCALKDQNEIVKVDEDGMQDSELGRTDQIGSLMPAVPTEENDTFWGYTSVPESGVLWWKWLPLRMTEKD